MKKRTEQHEIGDDGVTLFQEALRKANKNSKLTAVFNEQAKNDYGVDGELVLQNKLNSPRNHELFKYLNWLHLLCLILLYISDFT